MSTLSQTDQPINVGTTSSTYTVPAGRFAKVNISDTLLPVLNGSNLYLTTTMQPNRAANQVLSTSTTSSFLVANAHRVFINKIIGAGGNFGVNFSNVPASYTSNDDYYTVGGNASSTGYFVIFPNPQDLTAVSVISSSAMSVLGPYTVDYCSIKEMWLKPGDILTFNSGKVFYTEYTATF
jgi:hypothetical protein